MKKFTKLMLTMALLIVGVVGAKVYAEAQVTWEPATAFGANWNAATTTMSWEKNDNGWYILYTGITPNVQNNSTAIDLTEKYTKIHVNISEITGAENLELHIKSTGKDEKTIQLAEGETDIEFEDYSDVDFSKVLEITLWGTLSGENTSGSAVIDEFYLLTNNRWEYQTQQKTVYTRSLGTALSLSDVVSENMLVSIASGSNILYGTHADNQIYKADLETAMEKIDARGANESTYRFRISEATDDGLTYPAGITTLYKIRAYKGDGSVVYNGPWGGDGFVTDLGWTYNVHSNEGGCYYAIIPVDGKDNTYSITSYKKDGSKVRELFKSNDAGAFEWNFNVITETEEEVDVQVLVEIQVDDTEDPGVPAVAEGWRSLITNGQLDEDDVTNFRTKNEDGGELAAVIDETAGRMGGRGIKVVTKDNAANEWGTQFFIKSSESLKEGQKLHVEFDYRADIPVHAATQAHRNPGDYNGNIDGIDFTVNWKHYSNEFTITSGMCKQDNNTGDFYMLSFCLNLSENRSTHNFYFDNIVMWTEIEVASITMGDAGTRTYSSDKALDFTDVEGLNAYAITAFTPETATLTLTKVTEVPANTGLYLIGEAGDYNVPVIASADAIADNLLKASSATAELAPEEGDNTNLIFGGTGDARGFYKLSEAGVIGANKAYLQIPTADYEAIPVGAPLRLVFEDEATGITKVVNTVKKDNTWYTLNGVKLNGQPTEKGLYINKGKKVAIK